MSWETVIGLEIHAQLATASKIFSSAPTAYGAAPNRQANAVDLGMPGVLPVLNREVVKMAVKFGLAVDAQIGRRSVFARKNYFYPDLPKGYQISQFELPIVSAGQLEIQIAEGVAKVVRITRAHLEEDAGKSLHDQYPQHTAIDLNRAGTPLLEIVSEPDMRSAAEAVAYAKAVHSLVRYLGICDGNMQEGSFRCDANVSVRQPGDRLGIRTELKNINSFRFLERAIEFEVDRHIDILEAGGRIQQQTRLYDPERHETRPMRDKEDANDYRYFPDPDLLPLLIEDSFIEQVREALPELPQAKRMRLQTDYGLPAEQARILISEQEIADYFESVAQQCGDARLAANWVSGELLAHLKQTNLSIDQAPITAQSFAELLKRVVDRTITANAAKTVLEAMWVGDGTADEVIEAQNLATLTDAKALETLVDEVLAANPAQVSQFRAGKEKILGFLVGQVMKNSAGKADPAAVNVLLRRKLSQ